MISDPWFYAAAVPALLINGISKGGLGGGLGILAIPVIAMTLPSTQAAGIVLPVLMLMDAVGVWAYRKRFDARILIPLLPSAILGNSIGYLTFAWLNDKIIGLMVGLIAVGFTLDAWFHHQESAPAKPGNFWKGTFWGTISGFTSFVSHAGGPPLNVYLLPLKLDKSTFAGTAVMYFAFVNLTKLPAYAALGQFSRGNLLTALALSPVAPAGMYAGIWLQGRINPRWFFRIVYWLVFASGLKLIWEGGHYIFTR